MAMHLVPFVLASRATGLAAEGHATTDPATGQPVQRFVKAVIRTGVYIHPTQGWKLEVTPERIDGWVAAFGKMRANGVRVEVPVDHSFKADDNRGFVVDAYREGDRLMMVHELIGQDAIALAGRADVSVWIEPNFKDGKGVQYGEAIIHSSLVQKPVVPGLGAFVPMAASMGFVPVYQFGTLPQNFPAQDEAAKARERAAVIEWMCNRANPHRGK